MNIWSKLCASKTVPTSPELKGCSILYLLLSLRDFIFHLFGIIVAERVGIRITETLRVSVQSGQF